MPAKKIWFLPDEAGCVEPFGPFDTKHIEELLKKGELRLDSFIWAEHLKISKWCRIFETEEFGDRLEIYPKCPLPKKSSKGLAAQKKSVSLKFSKEGEYGRQNEFRRYPRAPFETVVYLHNQDQFIKAKLIDISEKGASIQTNLNNTFEKGETISLTIIGEGFFETFSVNTTVMRVLDKPYSGYGLYFLTLNPLIRRKIAEYVIQKLGGEQLKAAG